MKGLDLVLKKERKMKYVVWNCRIVVAVEGPLPEGFDSVPRYASVRAIEEKGIEVLKCASGWGEKLTEAEEKELTKLKS